MKDQKLDNPIVAEKPKVVGKIRIVKGGVIGPTGEQLVPVKVDFDVFTLDIINLLFTSFTPCEILYPDINPQDVEFNGNNILQGGGYLYKGYLVVVDAIELVAGSEYKVSFDFSCNENVFQYSDILAEVIE